MNNSQFAQERHQQHFGAPPTSQQQNGQFNTPSNSKLKFLKKLLSIVVCWVLVTQKNGVNRKLNKQMFILHCNFYDI